MSKLENGHARAWSKGGVCALILAQAVGCRMDAAPAPTGSASEESAKSAASNDGTMKKDKDSAELDSLRNDIPSGHYGGLGSLGNGNSKPGQAAPPPTMKGVPSIVGPVGGKGVALGDEGTIGAPVPLLDP